jgi:hypothetical protein
MCPTIACGGPPNESHKLSSIDQWLCSPSSCSVAKPCLWDVVADPEERSVRLYFRSNNVLLMVLSLTNMILSLTNMCYIRGDRNNLGGEPQFAEVVASLRRILVSLNSTVVPPYAAVKAASPGQLCRAYKGRGSRDGWPYFGPWKADDDDHDDA